MATITVVMKTKNMCNICVDFIYKHLKKNYGAKSVVEDRVNNQLKLVQKRSSNKIRENINLHKTRETTAVLRVNGKISAAKVKHTLWSSFPGITDVVMLDYKNTRKVRVEGRFAIHSLCEKLEKKPGVYVTVCSIKTAVGVSSSKNSCLMNPSKMLTTIQKVVAK